MMMVCTAKAVGGLLDEFLSAAASHVGPLHRYKKKRLNKNFKNVKT